MSAAPQVRLARLGVPDTVAAHGEPSPAQQREHERIVAHRARNWPNAGPWPPMNAGYLPKFRKGGGQREVGT